MFVFFFAYIYIFSFKPRTNQHEQYSSYTKVISDTSFESGMSDDYAIPPDALSQSESTCMDASMPSLLMRTSYADSPNKKMESLEKVKN